LGRSLRQWNFFYPSSLLNFHAKIILQITIKRQKMNRSDLIKALSDETGTTQTQMDTFLNAFIKTTTETLASGESIALVGFGTFKISDRAERQGRNPKTGESITIAARKSPSFSAGKALKDAVNT
jgi:DNA-binding protein HU-beta